MDGTPHLLTDVKFSERRRGYAPEEVDNFLERVSAAVAQLQDKLRDATTRAEEADARVSEAKRAQTVAEAQVDQLKAELQKAGGAASDAPAPAPAPVAAPASDPANDAEAASTLLLMAKKTADATIEDARHEAQTAVADAQAKATTLVADAEAEAAAIRSNAQRIADDLEQEQRAAARAEVVSLEEMKGSIRADIDALQRHVEREREDLRAAVARLSEVIDNPTALRVGEAPVVDTPGIDDVVAPAAGVEAVDEVDDPASTSVAGLSVDEEGEVDTDAEIEAATTAAHVEEADQADEVDGPAAGIESIDEVDDEVQVEAESASEAEQASESSESSESGDEAEAGSKLFADDDVVAETGPPTEAFQPFSDDAARDTSEFESPGTEDEDKAMRAFFETDFESMEADKRSRWRR